MPSAPARSRSHPTIRSERRLVAGIVVSVLLHGVLLSLQFGVQGLDLGSGGPIAVTLAPLASAPDMPAVSAIAPAPSALDTTTPAPTPTRLTPAPAPAPVTGLGLVDLPPAPVAAQPVSVKPRPQRTKPVSVKRRVRALPPPVIVAAPNAQSEFSVPLPDVVPNPWLAQGAQDEEDTTAGPEPAQPVQEEIAGVMDEAEESARLAQPEPARLAEEEQRRRELERAREHERIVQQQHAADEARQTSELEAQRRLADQQAAQRQRLAEEQAQQAHLDQERSAQEAALAARASAELTRERERQELAARQLAEQRAAEQALLQEQADAQAQAQRTAREQAQRLVQEQAERQRLEAQRLAQAQAAERQRIEELNQRLVQERVQQQADERARTERLARQADEAARQATAERLQAYSPGPALAAGSGQAGAAGAGRGDVGSGSGSGDRSQPGTVAGLPGSRARELLRGLTIPGAGVALPAPEQDDPRRVIADGGERDAPLRLYVDSVRQKLERNAVLGGARLALRDVRTDPLVSLALRSDGSIDAVTIIRSSGRPDMDEALRRFVRLNARYAAFPPNVAARFDVIEIRRIWRFTDSLKLLEEMR